MGTTIIFGSGLDVFGLGTVNSATDFGATVNLFELSFDTETDLNNLQPGAFTLASLAFDTIGTGSSILSLSVIDFADAAGGSLSIDTISGNVDIDAAAAVPLPAAFWMFAFAVPGLIGIRKKLSPLATTTDWR